MRYSNDLRKRALAYISAGGSQSAAAARYGITRRTLYNWLHAADSFAYVKPGPRTSRKLDWEALRQRVAASPDLMLKEYAAHFGVSVNGIFYACKRMGLSYKKRRGGTAKPKGISNEGGIT